jgi:hypothetical protein
MQVQERSRKNKTPNLKKKTRNLSIRRVRLIRLVSGRGPSLRPGRTDVGWYRRAVCIETRLIAAALAVQIPTQVSVGDPAGNTGPNLAWPSHAGSVRLHMDEAKVHRACPFPLGPAARRSSRQAAAVGRMSYHVRARCTV